LCFGSFFQILVGLLFPSEIFHNSIIVRKERETERKKEERRKRKKGKEIKKERNIRNKQINTQHTHTHTHKHRYPQLEEASAFSSAQCPEGVVAIEKNSLRIFSVDRLSENLFHQVRKILKKDLYRSVDMFWILYSLLLLLLLFIFSFIFVYFHLSIYFLFIYQFIFFFFNLYSLYCICLISLFLFRLFFSSLI